MISSHVAANNCVDFIKINIPSKGSEQRHFLIYENLLGLYPCRFD